MLSDTEGEAAARAARGGAADREGGLHLAYDKWSKLEITDDGDVVERRPVYLLYWYKSTNTDAAARCR